MTATSPATDSIVLLDVDDLAEADLEADLAERLELGGWVFPRPDGADAPAEAVSLARAIREGGSAAASVHDLGPRAAMLAG